MKPTLALLLLLLPLTADLNAKESRSAGRDSASEETGYQSPAGVLASQVKEITSSGETSPKSQAKLIANAVSQAITNATAGIKDPAKRLKVALELTTAAAAAAPSFAATITSTVSGLPSIANIAGALKQIQAAVSAGIAAANEAAGSSNSDSDSRRGHDKHEFDGPDRDEKVVSPSH